MIKIIQGDERHHNFILNSWLQNYFEQFDPKSEKPKYQGNKFPFMKKQTFLENHEPLIKKCLAKSSVLIAVNEEDNDQFIGYVVFEGKCIHYIYVKGFFRKAGIATKLISEIGGTWFEFSHISSAIYRTKKLKFTYNPYGFFKES